MKDNVQDFKVVIQSESGSYLYGLNTENSDKDYISIVIPTEDYILGLATVKEYTRNIVSKDENNKNTKEAVDNKYIEVKTFIEGLLRGIAGYHEILYNKNLAYQKDSFIKDLVENKKAFLSKHLLDRMFGYLTGELRKLTSISTDNYTDFTPYVDLLKTLDKCKPLVYYDTNKDFVKLFNNDNQDVYKIGSISLNKTVSVKRAIKEIGRVNKSQSNRSALIKELGYDCKSGSHIVRLLLQIKHILLYGEIKYPFVGDEHELIMKIKLGKMPLQELLETISNIKTHVRELELNNPLPANPNYKFANEILIKIYKEHLSLNK